MSTRLFRFVSTDRRVREDRRFVVGKGRFAADIVAAGTRHVALVTCPHPAARILAIDKVAAIGGHETKRLRGHGLRAGWFKPRMRSAASAIASTICA